MLYHHYLWEISIFFKPWTIYTRLNNKGLNFNIHKYTTIVTLYNILQLFLLNFTKIHVYLYKRPFNLIFEYCSDQLMLYLGVIQGHSIHPVLYWVSSSTQPMSCQRFVLSATTCIFSRTNRTCVSSFDVSLVYLRKNKRISLYVLLRFTSLQCRQQNPCLPGLLKCLHSDPNKNRREFATQFCLTIAASITCSSQRVLNV